MDKLFYNQYLMKYITSFIEKDPRKKYPDQEQKRRKLNKIIENGFYDEENRKSWMDYIKKKRQTQLWLCEYCEEPYSLVFVKTGHRDSHTYVYIKEEGGFDCCKECEDKGF